MPAATPDTRPTDPDSPGPDSPGPDDPETDTEHPRRPGGIRTHRWPVAVLAVLGWFVGLAPWFAARRTTGTFGTPWNPRNDMREALLPFHHQQLTLLLSVALFAGALAGAAPWWVRPRTGRRLAAATLLTLLAAAASVALSVWQTLSLHPDLGGSGSSPWSPETAVVLLTVAGATTGLVLGILVSVGSPAVRALATAPLAVIAANWAGLLVTHLTADPTTPARHDWLSTAMWVLTALVVGAALALGPRPVSAIRLVGVVALWLVALGLVWSTQSAFTVVRYFLEGVRGVAGTAAEVRALARDSLRILGDTVTPELAPWRVALLAVLVGLIGLAARAVLARPGTGSTPD